jgi:squalene synthase HpnC
VLSPLLPKGLVDDFAAVYAFCRRADDIADDVAPTPEARAQALRDLAAFRSALDSRIHPDWEPIDHPDGSMLDRLAETAQRRGLRTRHFHALLDAFERDQHQTRYETWDDLLSYCEGSADPVGRLVLELGGLDTTDPTLRDIVQMSDQVCSALQLTNHWQDIRRDLLERDRVYLPQAETGLSAADLRDMIAHPKDPDRRVRFIRALRPLVERTDALYREATGLPVALSSTEARPLAPTVWLLGAGGRSTLRLIERRGCTTLWHRPRLGPLGKASLIVAAAAQRLRFRG